MDKRENISSQIYLLSLDTFMIMTVMGITLGIIFFILNPNLNSGIDLEVTKLEYQVGSRKYKKSKNILLKNYNQDIEEAEWCSIITGDGNKIEIILDKASSGLKPYVFTFTLYDMEDNLIEKKSAINRAIQDIGLSFILSD
tara:strand:+ start:209 stop:631 length:423 start_codon:yes stop_codon:yes gene_type:complete